MTNVRNVPQSRSEQCTVPAGPSPAGLSAPGDCGEIGTTCRDDCHGSFVVFTIVAVWPHGWSRLAAPGAPSPHDDMCNGVHNSVPISWSHDMVGRASRAAAAMM